jgi:hypothetical protein
MKPEQEPILTYLELLRAIQRKNMRGWRREFYYAGMGDLLLQHGEWFPAPAATAHWQGMPRTCFHNSRMAAYRYRWRYAEGMAEIPELPGLPFHHAWCIAASGEVQEVTWRSPGHLYFGVIFSPPPLVCPVFDNGRNLDIYRQSFPASASLLIPTARWKARSRD